MQRQLIRMRRKKRARKRIMLVIGVSCLTALALVGMRACTGGFDESYNRASHPANPTDIMNPGNLNKLKELKKYMDKRSRE